MNGWSHMRNGGEFKSIKPKRVLCVEGNADNGMMMSYLLRLSGYGCECVETSAQGLQSAKGGVFDLYLLDTWYEDGRGVELCKRIREFDSTTPIIFFSAWVVRSAYREAIEAGADAYILKPALDELLRAIARLLTGIPEPRNVPTTALTTAAMLSV